MHVPSGFRRKWGAGLVNECLDVSAVGAEAIKHPGAELPLGSTGSGALKWCFEQTCKAVGDVDGAGAGQPGWQRHALQGGGAGLAAVLVLALLRLRVAVLAPRL